MAYQVKCDGYPLLDVRYDELVLINPKVKLEVNTVGEGSFTIYKNHPYYNKLEKLKSVFEVSDEIGVIFRGRMTGDSIDFENGKAVDLEGSMAFFNDSIVRPFTFPDDFLSDEEYNTAAKSGNVIEFFLGWLISQHNSQVQDFQKLHLGNVTVTDPNNYLSRSSTDYASTWETLKSKLFDSALGGYLCIRYEDDGNYIDYLADFDLTNTQDIIFGENLLDLTNETDATATYSAVIPIGAEIEAADGTKSKLTVSGLKDGDISSDFVKDGDTIYSRSAVERYGWIYAPVSETTWDDVTVASNLQTKAVEYLGGSGVMLTNTIEVSAVDLHFTDEEIQSFRIYRNVRVFSDPHGLSTDYQLTKLEIDLMNPQNTKITVGETVLTLIDRNNQQKSDTATRIETVEKDIEENRTSVTVISNQLIEQSTSIINTCNEIVLAALENYSETSGYNEFKETVETQMQLLADQLNIKISEVTEQIVEIDGELQKQYNTLTTFFTFEVDGLTIGKVDNPYTIVIDNDRYSMQVNGVEVLWIDAITREVHTPELTVTDRLRALDYLVEKDDNERVNCSYIGG